MIGRHSLPRNNRVLALCREPEISRSPLLLWVHVDPQPCRRRAQVEDPEDGVDCLLVLAAGGAVCGATHLVLQGVSRVSNEAQGKKERHKGRAHLDATFVV